MRRTREDGGGWREDGGRLGGVGKMGEDRINEGDTFVRCSFHFGTHTRICPQKRNSLASNCSITFLGAVVRFLSSQTLTAPAPCPPHCSWGRGSLALGR